VYAVCCLTLDSQRLGLLCEFVQRGLVEIEDHERMTGTEKVVRHVAAHVAQTDEAHGGGLGCVGSEKRSGTNMHRQISDSQQTETEAETTTHARAT
jgi:hypothetical protein